jgi:hypothetical protein
MRTCRFGTFMASSAAAGLMARRYIFEP